MNRFFQATALAGRLHLSDIPDHGLWEPSRIVYADGRELDPILTDRMMIRKVQTVEELDEVLKTSEGRAGSISLYVHEDLLGEAKRRWEEMRRELSTGAETYRGPNSESC